MTWNLKISKGEFISLYGDKVRMDIFEREPKDEADLVANFLPSKLWRLNNLYHITVKTIKNEESIIKFNMNKSQHRTYASFLEHPRLIILKSRQQGISTFWLIFFLDSALVCGYTAEGLMAQGEDEATTLLKRVKIAWEWFPQSVKNFLQLTLAGNNTKEYSFSNGSSIFIRNSFRSTTLHGLHISEFGKICATRPDRAEETKAGSMQTVGAGNPIIIESTAEGENDFKEMWDEAIIAEQKAIRTGEGYADDDFKPLFLSWLDDPDCVSSRYEEPSAEQIIMFKKWEDQLDVVITTEQRNFWISKKRLMKHKMSQEYPTTPEEAFSKQNEGYYYATAYNEHVIKQGRIRSKLYEPRLPVNVAMDLGVSDTFFMVFWQVFQNEIRVIDEYANEGEGLAHYVGVLNERAEVLGYHYNTIIGPHDLNVRNLGEQARTRFEILQDLGLNNLEILPRTPLEDGIESVRELIPNMYVDEQCEKFDMCMRKYSKSWDAINKVWKDKKPIHNKFSHGADATRYMAQAHLDDVGDVSDDPDADEDSEDVVDGTAF